jgi:putative flippase GtrA
MSRWDAMRAAMSGTGRLLLRELGAFGVVGAVAFAIDLGVFQVLYAHAGVGAVTAKALSTLVSVTVAYVGHRFWSFSHRDSTRTGRGYLLFALINGATLALGLAGVALVRYPLGQESPVVLQLTNIVTIALGTVIRYFAYRRWVFPARQPVAESSEDAEHVGDAATVSRAGVTDPRPA